MNESDISNIRTAIRQKYAEVAQSAEGKFQYATGKEGAQALGYDSEVIEESPAALLKSFCGVGNPFSLGAIKPDETVLDVGCGAGFDLAVASRYVGDQGKVFGIDLTEEMVNQAKRNMELAGVTNAKVVLVDSETIPFDDHMFDVVISNGVLNLSPCKETSFREIFRVLKPGGRLQFADIVLRQDLPPNLAGSMEAWSQ